MSDRYFPPSVAEASLPGEIAKTEAYNRALDRMVARPVRIQRRRTRGYNMQAESMALNGLPAVSVCRPGKWGNPFKAIDYMVYCDASHRRKILPPWVCWTDCEYGSRSDAVCASVELYEMWVRGTLSRGDNLGIVKPCPFTIADVRRELRGKNLACFCPLSSPCHADVLLRIANEGGASCC